MALISWQLLPLFSRFFKSLGFDVVLSGRTDKRIIRIGVESVTAQPCFPVKVAYGHITELIEKKVDYIFLPSVVSMTAGVPRNKYNKLCPYVQSLPYQIKTGLADKLGRTKILTAPIYLDESEGLVRKGFVTLGKKLGVSASAVRSGVKEAFAAQAGFERALKEKGREILRQIGPDQKLFVLISRPYNGCDEGVNFQLPEKLAELGVDVIPMDMLDLDKAELSDEFLHERLYWAYGQKILRAAEIIKNDPRLFAIYLSNFSCGPDSFLMTFFKDIMGKKPCLQLELDEHSADAGVITRLEAYLESLKNYRPQHVPTVKAPAPLGLSRERTLYIPYMGDPAYAMAACLRAYGQPAEVIPLADEAALLQGRAFTSGKECLPCAITTGDMLKLLKSDGVDPKKAAFFMPAASGPCRFGMYSCLQRLVLKYAGIEDVPVIAPDQDTRFHRAFMGSIDSSSPRDFLKSLWTAIVGADLLHKVIMRIRPFAADPPHAQQVYQALLNQWIKAVEDRRTLPELRRVMGTITDYFAAIELNHTLQKPRIGIVGEIYVRSHPFANMNIIARLEELGAACDLAPLAEWVYYTNFTRTNIARRQRRWGNLLTNVILNRAQHKIERELAAPLEEKFGPLAERPVEHVIELAAPYMHHSFEGEAILTVGKAIEYFHDGFGGVINAMPFTCMPSTVVSSISLRVSADCGGMPILNLSFDGQEDPALTTRLEAFVEQVRQRQFGSATFAQVTAAAV